MGRIQRARRAWSRSVGWKGMAVFLYLWLMVGFATGTLVLLGPARWLTGFVRTGGWRQGAEDALMIGVILIYVALSFLLALYLARLLLAYRARALKTGIVLLVTAAAAAALWGWMNPALYASMAGGGAGEEEVPDRARLAESKRRGVTAVVSVQHPAVVPFEPEGIARGKARGEEVGIRFVHAPMLPWVGDNEAALDTMRRVVQEGEGVYYVHCGRGRDRTAAAPAAAREARALPRPLRVIAPSPPPECPAAVAAAFRQAWQVMP